MAATSSLLSGLTRPIRGLLSRKADALVALDVGMSAVRSLHVRRDDGELVLDGYRVVRLRGGKTLADACRDALDVRLGDEPVAVTTASPEAAVRKVELPPMSPGELRQALPWEARRHVAGLAEDAIVDSQVLSPGGDRAPMEVLLVAFPRTQYDLLDDLLRGLDVDPVFVDVQQLATLNALSWRGPASSPGPVALLDLGSAVGSFAIFSRQNLILLRDLSPRVAHLNSLLFRAFGVDDVGLDGLRTSGKLPDGKTPSPEVIREVLAEFATELAEDLRSGFVYLENKTGTSLDHVYVTGSLSALLERSDLVGAIGAHGGVTLERFSPFAEMRLGVIDELGLKTSYSELCAAAGVAMRFFFGGARR